MKIAFLGYGSMASALASRFKADHELFIGGRSADKAATLAEEVGGRSGTAAEAAAFAEALVVATPHAAALPALRDVGADALAGTVLVDINNPVDVEDEFLVKTDEFGPSLSERIQTEFPRSPVVKAFNLCQAKVWTMDPPAFDGRTLVTPICGDDAAAKAKVADLVRAVGSDPLDVGGVRQARKLEALAALVIQQLMTGRDPHTVFNLIRPEVKPIA